MASRLTSTTASTSSYGGKRQLPLGSDPAWIDARFERAVDIVQSLPRSGPIQTNYEDKLLLYSVYKQATEGDVKSSRPGMLDVLGRAKWDAWNKKRGIGEDESKRLYVEGLLKILRGYSDRTQAVELIRELENFSLAPARQPGRDSDSSSTSTEGQIRAARPPPSTARSNRSRAPPPSSVAPSLPGYGPPRTNPDVIRTPLREESSDDYSSGSEHAGPPPRFGTPLQYAGSVQGRGQHQSGLQSPYQHVGLSASTSQHFPGMPGPSRVKSPNLPFPPTPGQQYYQQQPLRVAPSPGPSSMSQSMAMQYAPSQQSQQFIAPVQRPAQPAVAQPQQPPALDAALDRIQTSLTALHERLASLEARNVTANTESGISLLKQAFFRVLVVLHLRPAVGRAAQVSLWDVFVRLLRLGIRVGRRVMGDLGVLLLVVGILARLRGGDWVGTELARLLRSGVRRVPERRQIES